MPGVPVHANDTNAEHMCVTSVNAFINPGHYFAEPVRYGNVIAPPAYSYDKMFQPPPAYSELNFSSPAALGNIDGVEKSEDNEDSRVAAMQSTQAANLVASENHVIDLTHQAGFEIYNIVANTSVAPDMCNVAEDKNIETSQGHIIHEEVLSAGDSMAITETTEMSVLPDSALYEPIILPSPSISLDTTVLELTQLSSLLERQGIQVAVAPLMTTSDTDTSLTKLEAVVPVV